MKVIDPVIFLDRFYPGLKNDKLTLHACELLAVRWFRGLYCLSGRLRQLFLGGGGQQHTREDSRKIVLPDHTIGTLGRYGRESSRDRVCSVSVATGGGRVLKKKKRR